MPTMMEVAKDAGVSIATVSRVINNPSLVELKTRQSVLASIEELDYRPNTIAQDLVNKSSKTIGVVINAFGSPYYGSMLDGVVAALTALGYKTIAESNRESAQGEWDVVSSLLARQCEAIVLHSDKLSDTQIKMLLVRYPQIVLMNRLIDGFEDRCVYLDNKRGGEQAAEYLAKTGHKNMAIVTGPKNFFECQDRLKGFLKAAFLHKFEIDSDLIIEGEFNSSSGRDAMKEIWSLDKPITAVFFMNDEMAAGALDICQERGVSVPDDLSIIGFDDIWLADFLYPKLTTIRQPLEEIGKAAGLLAHHIATKGDLSKLKRVFEAEVIERASVNKINYAT